jgi:hypothetical protein
VSEATRLRALEDENRKLKKLLAESMLDQAALKELLTKNDRARRQARCYRSSAQYPADQRAPGLQPRCRRSQDDPLLLTAPPDVELRARLCDLANHRRRFSYRLLFILQQEQGEPSGDELLNESLFINALHVRGPCFQNLSLLCVVAPENLCCCGSKWW